MAQSDFGVIDAASTSGTDLAGYLNNGRNAWLSCHKGTARPSYAGVGVHPGLLWLKDATTDWELTLWDGTLDTVILSVDTAVSPRTVSLGNLNPINVTEGNSTASAHVDGDTGVFENNTNAGVSILATNTGKSSTYWGSPANNRRGYVEVSHSSNAMAIGTRVAGAVMDFLTGANAHALRITSGQKIGIGTTSPNANSKVHVYLASAGTPTFATNYDDFLIEGTGNIGLSVITNTAGIAGIVTGCDNSETGCLMQYDGPNTRGYVGTNKSGADFQINYATATMAMYVKASRDSVGVFQSDPRTRPSSGLHVGGAMATFAALQDTQHLVVVSKYTMTNPGTPDDGVSSGTFFQRTYLEGYQATGINFAVEGAKTDQRLFSIEVRGKGSAWAAPDDTYFSIQSSNDALSVTKQHFVIDLAGDDIYFPQLAHPTLDKTMTIEAVTGKVIMV